jgi:transforming growth factor-beta-induced protein
VSSLRSKRNSAFDSLDVEKLLQDQWRAHLTGILLYHAVPGLIMSSDLSLDASAATLEGSDVTVTSLDPVMINDAAVIAADVEASNGVIHVIDKVLLPPFAVNNIVEIAVSDPNTFSTLVDLVILANLADALSGDGPFTVFAPTNDAFSKLPKDTVDALIADPAGALTDILLYHVVPGVVLSSDLSAGSSPATLQGATLDVSLNPVMINNANVVAADGG